MNANNMSIKSLIISSLLFMGILSIIFTVSLVHKFTNTAVDTQKITLSRILEVTANEQLKKLEISSVDLAVDIKKDKEFKKLVKSIFRAKTDVLSSKMETHLSSQFNQRYVTTGILDLKKIRVYDTKFKLIVQSKSGLNDLGGKLPDTLFNSVKLRKGADRLKSKSALWISDARPMHSTLLPVGGLKLKGYLEVVVAPDFNMYSIHKILHTPVAIFNNRNEVTKETNNWRKSKKNSLKISYGILDSQSNIVMRIEARENAETLFNKMSEYKLTAIIGFSLVIIVSIVIVITILNKYLFKSFSKLVGNMKACASGDLTVDISTHGLKEISYLSVGLKELVDKIRFQVELIQKGSNDISVSTKKLTSIVSSTNKGIETQSQETNLLATAMTEMTSTVQGVSCNASDAETAAKDALDQSAKGQEIVQKTIKSIQDLDHEVENASNVIKKVEDNTDKIGAILEVIQGIADQTNLLALNAAIEAARAGEQGRGFAVVADEVRTLASRTQESTKEIQEMIGALQEGASAAVSIMDHNKIKANETVQFAIDTGISLTEVIKSNENISVLNTQIATVSGEQSIVAEEINRNIVNISEVASNTSSGATETNQACTDLDTLSKDLMSLVSNFKIK